MTLVYLIYEGAMAAWIPLVVEIVGCLGIMGLKWACAHTSFGDRGREARAQVRVQRAWGRLCCPAR